MATAPTELVSNVEAALMQDKRTKDCTINVAVLGGVVTLTGEVPSIQAKQAAEEIARSRPGVVNVVNDLRPAPTG